MPPWVVSTIISGGLVLAVLAANFLIYLQLVMSESPEKPETTYERAVVILCATQDILFDGQMRILAVFLLFSLASTLVYHFAGKTVAGPFVITFIVLAMIPMTAELFRPRKQSTG